MSAILAVATAQDTLSRQRELLAAALLAQAAAGGDGPCPITFLNTGPVCAESAAIAAGIGGVYQLADPLHEQPSNDALLDGVAQACARFSPTLLLLSGDDSGVELGARLAVRAGAACISGCCGFERADEGAPHYRRAVYGGRALETLSSTAPLTIVCLRPKSFDASTVPSPIVPEQPPQTLVLKPSAVGSAVTRLEVVTTQQAGAVQLEDAAIIVSGGRGVDGVKGFAQLDELAFVLGGALGASRAAVDLGWISAAHQVGQTGKTVAPEVYLAVGISGAMQHLAGIGAARRVVAINSDDQAPIFSVADVGVVADAKALVPALLTEIKNLWA